MSPGRSHSNARADVWLAAFFVAVFGGMALLALTYPLTSRTLPLLVGSLGATLSVCELIRASRSARQAGRGRTALAGGGLVAMGGWLVAAVTVVWLAGILAGSAAFMAAFLAVRERERPASTAIAALMLPAVLHLALERALGLQLFEGFLFR